MSVKIQEIIDDSMIDIEDIVEDVENTVLQSFSNVDDDDEIYEDIKDDFIKCYERIRKVRDEMVEDIKEIYEERFDNCDRIYKLLFKSWQVVVERQDKKIKELEAEIIDLKK